MYPILDHPSFVFSPFGATALFTLLCLGAAALLARKNSQRGEQLFNALLTLFKLGSANVVDSIQSQGRHGGTIKRLPPSNQRRQLGSGCTQSRP